MSTRILSKQLLLGLLFLFVASIVRGQDTAFITFPSGTRLCDTASYRLVFSDDFDSTELDRTHWHSYSVWSGMTPTEHDNWADARVTSKQSIAKDENVVVKDGICNLILRKETTSWRCDTCRQTFTRSYSTGGIVTYYTRAYRFGKIEARIRFPKHRWAHGAFWTWPAESPSADKDLPELDIVEAYGYKGVPIAGNNGFQHAEWATHRWKPNNAYSLKQSRRFPRQTFAAWLRGAYFDFTKWHTYTAEWDENRIGIYLDGELVDEVWRYYCEDEKGRLQPSGCDPGTRRCYEDSRWPTSDYTSGSNVRLTTDIDADKIHGREGEVGRMQVDYFRVWQRVK